MKYHVIKGVPINVCTAEQKIAYNMAFRAHIAFQEKFNESVKISRICSDELIHDIIKVMMEIYNKSRKGNYDVDAIFSALNAGLYGYMEKPFIAIDYGQIGNAFPAHYLEK